MAHGAAAGEYDVQHVFAHETGGAIGFNDNASDPSVVMYIAVNTNDTSNRKLGRGDANADNAKY